MNKEDILKKIKNSNNDEMVEHLDNKSSMYSIIVLFILCILVMIVSPYSHYPKELIYIPLCLMSSFLSVFTFVYYYYLKKNHYLIFSCISFICFVYAIVQIWIMIW